MGADKLRLPFGAEEMLSRVVRILASVVQPVVVAARAGQELPPVPAEVRVAYDCREGLGPLQGIATGLEALGADADAAFVTGCDTPLLEPGFVRRMIELSAGFDITVPHVRGWDEPLAGVYRAAVLPHIHNVLQSGQRRIVEVFDRVRVRRVTAEELADVDPQLRSLVNVNDPDQYRAALHDAGL